MITFSDSFFMIRPVRRDVVADRHRTNPAIAHRSLRLTPAMTTATVSASRRRHRPRRDAAGHQQEIALTVRAGEVAR
jgi:hypothetical protein